MLGFAMPVRAVALGWCAYSPMSGRSAPRTGVGDADGAVRAGHDPRSGQRRYGSMHRLRW